MKCVFPVFEGNILLRKTKSQELSTFLALDVTENQKFIFSKARLVEILSCSIS